MSIFGMATKVELQKAIARLEETIKYNYVRNQRLEKVQDLVCNHVWQDKGTSPAHWVEVECKQCGRILALACEHGGSMACPSCVAKFMVDNNVETHHKEKFYNGSL